MSLNNKTFLNLFRISNIKHFFVLEHVQKYKTTLVNYV